jgi:hypothetical protein
LLCAVEYVVVVGVVCLCSVSARSESSGIAIFIVSAYPIPGRSRLVYPELHTRLAPNFNIMMSRSRVYPTCIHTVPVLHTGLTSHANKNEAMPASLII